MNVNIAQLNKDIELFPQVTAITDDMTLTFEGVSRLIMLDRYSFKDTKHKTTKVGDLVVLTINPDPNFPARGIGNITHIEGSHVTVKLEEAYANQIGNEEIVVHRKVVDKPLEIYYEQIAARNARGLASVESTEELRQEWAEKFYEELASLNFIPAGRVIYGAGSGTDVTYFNCYVMPYPQDSREGIGAHRNEVMEIMSRGGGVGTNGSTLRPRNALARGVNGKSSGSVSWLDDIAKLTHLVEQGGSRRGAQMIMLQSDHPDILEFIISKMQNPKILRFIIETTKDDEIRDLAQQKLKFAPLSDDEHDAMASSLTYYDELRTYTTLNAAEEKTIKYARELLDDGGRYSVHNPEFLSGANISVAITHDFMEAVENDDDYELRFPDVENYTPEQMADYNENWHKVGDVREWHLPVKTYRTIKAKALWDLINICATYAAEPGVFFIDNANGDTNAVAYGQKVVCTNPCGEQPLAPYSVCNLAAINLANMVDKETKKVDVDKLRNTVRVGVRMQDNVIDSTPYFLEANKKQALGERRVGLGVMGLADMLIYLGVEYGSDESLRVIDKVFEIISHEAYRMSIELAKEKGSFPFLEDDENGTELQKRKAFINSGYMSRMPEDIRQGVLDHGIRNSHLLTVAPTGSTGSMVGVSTGLEPYFAFKYYRSGRLGKFMEVNAAIVDELGFDADNLPDYFVTAMDLAPEAHVDVQNAIQKHVDSSLSKTVNAPKGYSVEQVQAVYERLYAGGAKGGTVYVDGSRDAQVLSLTADENTREDSATSEPKKQYEAPVKPLGDTVVYGTEEGNTCPICRQGNVIERGGCMECDNCGAQLKCGL
ncbi:vitamin B12-dependent ribonucleotide reductase [Bacillus sp. 7894-2]|uniref:vitamin B12-dependent ribonucleotide reductase n=1 Tax=Bacillus sp. 7894-2 TaxID=2021695 RepID=UPI000BA6ACE6|nr:vitamin B12-dependent ribonucleotide reductase [Bacillus sp. 7894-2]PAE24034.1 ribonucleoside-diphosphate reductase, adenosylcobalamin-dependent [Bacillus sp. 7894-2]